VGSLGLSKIWYFLVWNGISKKVEASCCNIHKINRSKSYKNSSLLLEKCARDKHSKFCWRGCAMMAGHVAAALFFQQAQELFTTRSLMQTDRGGTVTCNRDMEVVSNAQKVFHFVHESPILHSQWTASSSVIGSDAQQQNSSWVMRFHFVHLRRRPAGKQNCSGCLCVTPASQTSRNGKILLRKQFGKGGEE
jgi:hypothetical protein